MGRDGRLIQRMCDVTRSDGRRVHSREEPGLRVGVLQSDGVRLVDEAGGGARGKCGARGGVLVAPRPAPLTHSYALV